MDALAAAKKRVGQSFGSMQVKEWERFETLVRDVKLSRNQDTLAQNLREMQQWVEENKELMNAALDKPALSGAQVEGQAQFDSAKAIEGGPPPGAVRRKEKPNGNL
jgi:hypothetical protein